jgi:hypothetical protein
LAIPFVVLAFIGAKNIVSVHNDTSLFIYR